VTFEEAMTRARAAHAVVRELWQPGNDYRIEYVCSQGCGMFGTVFESRWEQHIVEAADALIAADQEGEARGR